MLKGQGREGWDSAERLERTLLICEMVDFFKKNRQGAQDEKILNILVVRM